MHRPTIGITSGDPAGVGPEIVLKAVCDPQVRACCRPLVIGDVAVLDAARVRCGLRCTMRTQHEDEPAGDEPETITVVDVKTPDIDQLQLGVVQALGGRAAFGYIEQAVKLAFAHAVDAIATAPIHKVALKQAEIPFVGHTEILAGLTGARHPLTMFEVHGLRIFFLTRHVSLRQACDLVTRARVLDAILRSTRMLDRLDGLDSGPGDSAPPSPARPLAVAALNPHGGEGGLLGHEEVEEIEPAIAEARQRGYAVEGPIGADSVFHLALQGRYRGVLSLYHDQGHIAAKTLDFERTVSLTLGLPFLRTSVDHGTAFDLAGSGRASAASMVEAIMTAARYAPRWKS